MSAIINLSINLDKIDKSKVIKGKKGQYYNVTVAVNDEVDQFGNHAAIFESQTKEERDAKANRNYLGNGKLAYSTGIPNTADMPKAPVATETADLDLPF